MRREPPPRARCRRTPRSSPRASAASATTSMAAALISVSTVSTRAISGRSRSARRAAPIGEVAPRSAPPGTRSAPPGGDAAAAAWPPAQSRRRPPSARHRLGRPRPEHHRDHRHARARPLSHAACMIASTFSVAPVGSSAMVSTTASLGQQPVGPQVPGHVVQGLVRPGHQQPRVGGHRRQRPPRSPRRSPSPGAGRSPARAPRATLDTNGSPGHASAAAPAPDRHHPAERRRPRSGRTPHAAPAGSSASRSAHVRPASATVDDLRALRPSPAHRHHHHTRSSLVCTRDDSCSVRATYPLTAVLPTRFAGTDDGERGSRA